MPPTEGLPEHQAGLEASLMCHGQSPRCPGEAPHGQLHRQKVRQGLEQLSALFQVTQLVGRSQDWSLGLTWWESLRRDSTVTDTTVTLLLCPQIQFSKAPQGPFTIWIEPSTHTAGPERSDQPHNDVEH